MNTKTFTTKRDIRTKSGLFFPSGTKFAAFFREGVPFVVVDNQEINVTMRLMLAMCGAETPSVATMEKWAESGVARTVFGEKTEPDGHGIYGEPSWLLAMGLI